MVTTRLLIADDHHLIRVGLRHLLQEQPSWTVVAEAQDGREAVRKARETKPDVAVIDLGMPELNGFEACEQIVSEVPGTKVLILSVHESDTVYKKVLASGARGYLLKSDAPRDLVGAVEAIRGNKTFFTARVSQLMVDGFLKPRHVAKLDELCLTSRQIEIVKLIAEGHNNDEVAVALHISRRTVVTHRANLMKRLNLHSVPELVRYAMRNGILQP